MQANIFNAYTIRRARLCRLLEIGIIISLASHIIILQTHKKMGYKAVIRDLKLDSIQAYDIPVTKMERLKAQPPKPFVPIPTDDPTLTLAKEPIDIPIEWVPDPLPPPPSQGTWSPPFTAVEQQPAPVGGYAAIARRLVYPDLARRSNVSGQVIVAALINEKGRVIETRILKSLGPAGCDEAAIAAIQAVRWTPGMQRDKPVQVWVSIPVTFSLKGA